MRTTVTLDPAVERLLKRVMKQSGLSFKVVLNRALQSGLNTALGRDSIPAIATPTFALGARGGHSFDRALALADALQDDDIATKRDLNK